MATRGGTLAWSDIWIAKELGAPQKSTLEKTEERNRNSKSKRVQDGGHEPECTHVHKCKRPNKNTSFFWSTSCIVQSCEVEALSACNYMFNHQTKSDASGHPLLFFFASIYIWRCFFQSPKMYSLQVELLFPESIAKGSSGKSFEH